MRTKLETCLLFCVQILKNRDFISAEGGTNDGFQESCNLRRAYLHAIQYQISLTSCNDKQK